MAIDLIGPANASGAVTVRPGETRVFGVTDTWFRDCSDPLTDDGTAYEAAFFNGLLANARTLIRGNGQTGGAVDVVTQDNSDDLIWRACQHLYQRGQPVYADDTGVANAVIVALTPAPAEHKKGMRIHFKVAANNTGATVINVNGLAQKAIKTVALQALQKGMLVVGQHATVEYDGTDYQLVSVFSERVTFTPRATIDLAAIASVPNGVWSSHNTTLGSQANMTAVVGASSFTMPDGTYLILGTGATRLNNVINSTHAAHRMRLTKDGVEQGSDFEAFNLIAGADATTYRMFACVVQAISTNVFAAQSWAAVTAPGDFNGANALVGKIEAIRLGN